MDECLSTTIARTKKIDGTATIAKIITIILILAKCVAWVADLGIISFLGTHEKSQYPKIIPT